MIERLRDLGAGIKRELAFYRRVLQHDRTPWLAHGLLWIALAYVASPIDLIPDFIPILGHLDDLIIVPAMVIIALRLIPDDVIAECRKAAENP